MIDIYQLSSSNSNLNTSNNNILKSISNNLSLKMPTTIDNSITNQHKHLCIRLATGPQYYG